MRYSRAVAVLFLAAACGRATPPDHVRGAERDPRLPVAGLTADALDEIDASTGLSAGVRRDTTATTNTATSPRATTTTAPSGTSHSAATKSSPIASGPHIPDLSHPPAPDDPCRDTMPGRTVTEANAAGAYEYDRATGALRWIAKSVGPVAYNPDGRHVAYVIGTGSPSYMCLGDRVTSTARSLLRQDVLTTYSNYPPQWAGPTLLLYAADEFDDGVPMTNLYRHDMVTGASTRFATNATSMRVSPTGLVVAYGLRTASGVGGDLYIAPVVGDLAHQLFVNPYYTITMITWSPDSTHIAVGDPLFIVNAVTGTWTKHLGCAGGAWGAAWSPDGTRVAFTTAHVPVECVYVVDRITGVETQIGSGGGPEDWSPDGTRLLMVGSGTIPSDGLGAVLSELTLADGARHTLVVVTPTPNTTNYFNAEYSPDGRAIRLSHSMGHIG